MNQIKDTDKGKRQKYIRDSVCLPISYKEIIYTESKFG